MGAQIQLPETANLVRRAPDPLEILQSAVDKNLTPETLKQLMDLQERWEANEAKKEYVEAMNAFKRNPPTISKNKHVKFGNTQYDHATLDHVCEEVTEALSAHGISHRWKVSQNQDRISVTCILTHQRGHSEETTLEGPADNSGSKNAIQAIGSTVTYLQRYTLLAATGLAAGEDNDGHARWPDLQTHLDEIKRCETVTGLQSAFTSAYKLAKDFGDQDAMLKLIASKDERKKELR